MSSTTLTQRHPAANLPTAESHPTDERLIAYHRGLLEGMEEEEIQEHFLHCTSCRQMLLALADFLSVTPVAPRWNPDDLVAAWQELKGRQGQHGREAASARR